MRTGITIGITKDGKAEIIAHPNVSVHQQRRAFNEIGSPKGKYKEIQYWESGRGMRRRTRFGDEKGGVDFNSAHLVELQQDKNEKKNLPDLTPTRGTTGGVNFDASIPVEDQGKKSAAPKKAKAIKQLAAKKPVKKAKAIKQLAAKKPASPARTVKKAEKKSAKVSAKADAGPTL